MLIKLILLIILIIINGIFSATEIAFLSINKYKLNKEIKKDNIKAKKILDLLNDSSTFLSSIQISITLSGFLASAFAAENFASELSEILNINFLTTNILIIIITCILSYFTLVFGELIPKKIGLAYSEKISYSMVNIINITIIIFKPFILILKNSVNFFSKLLNIKQKEDVYVNEVRMAKMLELFFDNKEDMINLYFTCDLLGFIKQLEKYAPREDVIKLIIDMDDYSVYNSHSNFLAIKTSASIYERIYNWFVTNNNDQEKINELEKLINEDKIVSDILKRQNIQLNNRKR